MKSLLSFLLIPSLSFSFVFTKSESGEDIKWKILGEKIVLYYSTVPENTNITLDIDESNLTTTKSEYIESKTQSILQSSINQWNSSGKYTIELIKDDSLPGIASGSNTFRFSDDPRFFGPGVIGVTTISFGADAGEISSADILINQASSSTQLSLDPSKSASTYAFIGDVLTHEIGHFLGLSHSQTTGSSMVFSIFKDQHHLHSDDIAGIQSLYDVKKSNRSISGEVVAGDDLKGVFGSYVNLYSVNKNEVIQSVVTDEFGSFNFFNLDEKDSYLIKVDPLRNLDSISEYYKNVNNNLCGQSEYKESFFSKCGSRSLGKAQVFRVLEDSELNIGSVTVKCDENFDPLYLSKKIRVTDRQYPLLDYNESSSSTYAYFSDIEIASGLLGNPDEFSVDLRYLNTDSKDPSLFNLKLNFAVNTLSSAFDIRVLTKRLDQTNWQESFSTKSPSGKINVDRKIELPLSSDASQNIFEVKVYPIKLSEQEIYEIFSVLPTNSSSILNKNNIYHITTVVEEGNLPVKALDSYPYEDNNTCGQGKIISAAKPYKSKSTSDDTTRSNVEDSLALGCGTISIDNGGGPSTMAGAISMIILMQLFVILRKFCRNPHF